MGKMEDNSLKLDQLIPVERLRQTLKKFHESVKAGCIIVCPRGEIVLEVGWQHFCSDCSSTVLPALGSCVKTESFFEKNLPIGTGARLSTCNDGLTSAGVPILVKGKPLAYIFIGQFLLSSPGTTTQKANDASKAPTTSKHEYSSKIPVFSDEKLKLALGYLELVAELLAEMAEKTLQERKTDWQLFESDERYKDFINSLPQIIYEFDLKGRLTFVNQSAYEVFGYTPQEVDASFNLFKFLLPSDHKRVTDRLQGLFSGQEVKNEEYSFIRKDGSYFIGLVYSRPTYFSGMLQGGRGIIVDVTQRRQVEKTLQESELRYRTLFDGANDAIFVFDRQNIIDCNEKAVQMFKRSRQELVGSSLFNLSLPAEPGSQLSTSWAVAMDEAAQKKTPQNFEWIVHLPDGNNIETEVSLSQCELAGDMLFQALIRDITERNQSKRHLEERESLWSAIFQRSPFGITINRLCDGVYLDVNPAFETIAGCQASEVINTSFHRFVQPDQVQRVHEKMATLQQIGWLSNQEAVFHRNVSEPVHILYSAAIVQSGKEPCFVTMFADISERRKIEENLQRNEATLQSLFRAVPVGLAIMRGRTIFSVNDKLCTIVGYDASDLTNISSRHLYGSDEESDKVGVALYESLWEQGTSYVETRFRRQDGSFRDVSLYGAPLDANNPDAGAAVAIQDITERKKTEETLRQSEERLSFAIKATSDAIWEWNLEDNSTYYSPRWYEMLGYSNQELPMTVATWKQLCHPDDFQTAKNAIRTFLDSVPATGYASEFRMRHRNGNWVWLLGRGNVKLRDADGNPLLLAGTNTDISLRKIAEQVILESEKRYRTIFESANDAILIIYNGQVIDCNRTCLEMLLCCSRQEIIGRLPHEIFVPLQPNDQSSEEESHKLLSEAATGTPQYFECHCTRFDGSFFQAEVNLSAVELSGEKYHQAVIRDVTERKAAEIALRESEFRFRSFYNSNPEGIIIINFQGVILNANKAFLKESGYSIAELSNRPFQDFINEMYQSQLVKALLDIKAGISQTDALRISYIDKKGDAVPISVKAWLAMDEKSTPLYLGIFIHNLTTEIALTAEKVTLEKQVIHAQKSEAIGTLAGGIAHDFNNILGGIIGFSELALFHKSLPIDTKVGEYLHRILEAGNRAKDLVQQILRFSRNNNVEMELISFASVVKEAIPLLRSTLPTSIDIRQQIDIDNDRILADSTQVHQVIMNLVTNAFHAMRETGGIVTISLDKVTLVTSREFLTLKIPPGEYLKFRVADTGSGISPSVMQRIFEPYFTTKKINEGTGLGLAVTAGIVRSHNGLIEVESIVGQGTSFDVFLPLSQAVTAENVADSNGFHVGHGQQVLIVDDEPFFLEVIRDSLIMFGYQVTASNCSLKTLKIFQDDPDKFDLLITDQTMPGMTGAQLALEVRKISSTIPIILCTGYSETITEDSASYYGITSFLMKPVNVNDLAKTVHEVLPERRTRQHGVCDHY